MAGYRLTPAAIDDIDRIWDFIAADNAEAADRVEVTILEACEALVLQPLMGRVRADLTSRPVRFWTVPRFRNYLIVYRPDTDPIQIIRVVHGKRDIRRVLESED